MSPSIRRVQPGDGLALREIRLTMLTDTPDAFASTHEVEAARPMGSWAERAAAVSRGDHQAIFAAVDHDGRWVGLAGGYRDGDQPDDVVDLFSMWVEEPARGTGLANQLIDAVVAWATETAANAVELWVTIGNDAAHQRYERYGFVDIDAPALAATSTHTCADEQRMRLVLAPSASEPSGGSTS